MNPVGIEAMNVFAGTACLDVTKLARHRKLDMSRFENLLMKKSQTMKFGTRNLVADTGFIPEARSALGEKTLFLKQINEFRREYEWVS